MMGDLEFAATMVFMWISAVAALLLMGYVGTMWVSLIGVLVATAICAGALIL